LKLHRLVVALAVPLLVAPAIAHAADSKLAFVDLQRAISETEEGRATKEKLQTELENKQKEIDDAQAKLKKEKDLLDRQASAMSEETRNQKAQELQQKVMQLGEKFQADRAHMAAEQQKALKDLFDKMNPIIETIAQREGIYMVFEKHDSGLVYAPPSADITNELVRMYNAKYHVQTAKKSSKGKK
jgi:outer membrane protein